MRIMVPFAGFNANGHYNISVSLVNLFINSTRIFLSLQGFTNAVKRPVRMREFLLWLERISCKLYLYRISAGSLVIEV